MSKQKNHSSDKDKLHAGKQQHTKETIGEHRSIRNKKMGEKSERQKVKYKIGMMAILLAGACILVCYYHVVLGIGTIFTHFFYIPIILAAIWWKRKGLVVAVILSALLVSSHILFRPDVAIANDYLRAFMFIVIAVVVAKLSERIAKEEELLRAEVTKRKQAEEELLASSERFRALTESTSDWIWEVDENVVYTYVNPKVKKLLGYEQGEVIGKTPFDLMPPDEAERVGTIFSDIMASQKPFGRLENVNLNKDGRVVVLETSGVPIFDAGGGLVGYRGIDRDITECKQAEAKLKQVAEEWKTTFDSITDMVSIHDKDFKIIRANKSFAKAFNMKQEEIIGKTCYELIHGTKEPPPFCPHKRTLDTGKPKRKEFFEPHLGIYIEVSTSPLFDENGQVMATVHIAKDVTERKQVEENLCQSEEKFRTFMETASDLMLITDKDENITYLNESMARTLGYSKEEMLGMNITQLLTKEALEKDFKPQWEKFVTNRKISIDTTYATKDGKEVYGELKAVAIYESDGKYIGSRTIFRDTTERKQVKEALRENENKYRTLLESLPQKVFSKDRNSIYVSCNENYARELGIRVEEFKGKTDYEFFPKELAEKYRRDDKRIMESGTTEDIEEKYIRNGQEMIVQTVKTPIKDEQDNIVGILGIFWDITDVKQAEAELKATQEKLIETAHKAGMAEVAADVLHNVGNVLNSINVSTTVIKEKVSNSEVANLEKVAGIINEHTDDLGTFLTEDPQGKHIPVYLTEVSKCLQNEQTDIIGKLKVLTNNVQHIKDIVGMQQSYAKVSGIEVQTSLSKLAEDAIQINSAGLERHGARLIREYDELGDVEIDKQKVLQVLVNLISNAKYALSGCDKEEKLLTIRIYKHGEERFRVEVADNGVGISEDNLAKIFSYGFTTKKDGHGVGLHSSALAAKELGGSLTVHSDGLGQGATFTLELPFKSVEVMK